LIKIIQNELKNNNFDINELNIAKENYYYRHIDFSKIS